MESTEWDVVHVELRIWVLVLAKLLPASEHQRLVKTYTWNSNIQVLNIKYRRGCFENSNCLILYELGIEFQQYVLFSKNKYAGCMTHTGRSHTYYDVT